MALIDRIFAYAIFTDIGQTTLSHDGLFDHPSVTVEAAISPAITYQRATQGKGGLLGGLGELRCQPFQGAFHIGPGAPGKAHQPQQPLVPQPARVPGFADHGPGPDSFQLVAPPMPAEVPPGDLPVLLEFHHGITDPVRDP